MKNILFILVLSIAANAHGQTLKELLFSGKLKKDSTGVVRKTDDLSSKIDTSTKKVEPVAKTPAATKQEVVPTKTAIAAPITASTTTNDTNETAEDDDNGVASASSTPAKSTTKIWKEYSEQLVNDLKKDVLSNRKIKKETYFISVSYEIGTDGRTNVLSVTCSPESDILLTHVRQQLDDNSPQVNPVLNPSGEPQKVKRKYNFFITKD